MKKDKLNLGCGKDIKKDYVNLDCIKLPGVDKVHDLEKFPYPFKDNSFEEIYCRHVLEHLSDLQKVMKELWRISKLNAKIKIIVPFFSSRSSFTDPTHKRFFGYETWNFFTVDFCHYSKAHFEIEKRKILFFTTRKFMKQQFFAIPINFLINLFPILYERYFCWIFPAAEIHVILRAKK